MKFTEETVKAAAFPLSAFCSSQECGTCPFGGKDGNAEIPCLFKSAEPATWFPMALEMNEPGVVKFLLSPNVRIFTTKDKYE